MSKIKDAMMDIEELVWDAMEKEISSVRDITDYVNRRSRLRVTPDWVKDYLAENYFP